MAKNTLTFEEVKPTGSITVGTTASATDKTLWKGDEVTLAAGEKITIPSFTDGYEKVYLVDTTDGTTAATLTASSNSFTNEAGSSKSYYIVVDNNREGVVVRYEIEHTAVMAGYDVDESDYETLTVGEETYYADPTYYGPNDHIELPKGSTIRLHTADTSGAVPSIYVSNESPHSVYELTSAGHTAEKDEELIICGAHQYLLLGIKFQIIERGESAQDTALSGTAVYTNENAPVYLKEGDKVGNTTTGADIILLDAEGCEIATIPNNGSYYKATRDMRVYFCTKTSGATLTYTMEEANPKYEEEYTGASGILTLKRKEGGKLYFYADAGIGYMQVFETKAKEVMYYLNMDGLDSVKIVSETEVSAAKVSEV